MKIVKKTQDVVVHNIDDIFHQYLHDTIGHIKVGTVNYCPQDVLPKIDSQQYDGLFRDWVNAGIKGGFVEAADGGKINFNSTVILKERE